MTLSRISLLLLTCLFCLQAAVASRSRSAAANLTKLMMEEGEQDRKGRLFSIFQVIQFPNDECKGSDAKNGTCYTANECENLGGTKAGSCADGYGICCILNISCGKETKENSTYFESGDNLGSGQCAVKICKSDPNICQLRLDLETFSISQPSTATISVGKMTLNARDYSVAGNCVEDSFAVINPGGVSPPVICGDNNGEHMYVNFASNCVTLSFNLGSTGSDDAEWSVRSTQYACDYSNSAPQGCLQYFFGEEGEGTIQSFNFKAGQHLAYQTQKVCIRREVGTCQVCYTTEKKEDFQISGDVTVGVGVKGTLGQCCGYSYVAQSEGYDCLIIPSLSGITLNGKQGMVSYSEICGSNVLFDVFKASAPAGADKTTLCSKRLPFELTFLSDGVETVTAPSEVMNNGLQNGFKISYQLGDCATEGTTTG